MQSSCFSLFLVRSLGIISKADDDGQGLNLSSVSQAVMDIQSAALIFTQIRFLDNKHKRCKFSIWKNQKEISFSRPKWTPYFLYLQQSRENGNGDGKICYLLLPRSFSIKYLFLLLHSHTQHTIIFPPPSPMLSVKVSPSMEELSKCTIGLWL